MLATQRHRIFAITLAAFALSSLAPSVLAEYNPRLGRFMQRDSHKTGAASALGLVQNARPHRLAAPLSPGAQYADGLQLYEYLSSRPPRATDPTGFYGEDIHFYMTYYLAAACGLTTVGTNFERNGTPRDAAYVVAWANQTVDVHPFSQPLKNRKARKAFHFPTTPLRGALDQVLEASQEAAAQLREGWWTGDLMLFGAGMHVFQDSYSHAGYGPRLGHAGDGNDPDRPFLNVPKAFRMAWATYEHLEMYMLAHHRSFCTTEWDAISSKVRKLLAGTGTEAQRIARWQAQLKKDFGVTAGFRYGGKTDVWRTPFEKVMHKIYRER